MAPPTVRAASTYCLRVEGHLDDHWSSWFGDVTMTRDTDGATSITGAVVDQAELHGLLTKVRDLGVALISVDLLDPARLASPAGVPHVRSRPRGEGKLER